MARFRGSPEQQQAAGTQAVTAPPNRARSDAALQRYLELQNRKPLLTTNVAGSDENSEPAARQAMKHGKRGGAVTHKHLVIDGRAVEVTEDDIGVTELHLE